MYKNHEITHDNLYKLKNGVVLMDIISAPLLLVIIMTIVGMYIVYLLLHWFINKKKHKEIDPNEVVVKNQDELP